MEALNDFSGGMQSDVSKLIQAKNTYLEAINFRPFTEMGASNTSLVTIKGNSCGVKFPTMNDVYKLKLNIRRSATFSDTIDIDITGPWGTDSLNTVVINSSTNIFNIYTQITALPNYGTQYTAAYKDDYIMIYQRTTTVDCVDDIDTFTVSVTENTLPNTQNTIWFVGPNNSFFSSGVTLWPNGTPYITAPVDPLIPIGYTTVLEDIYLFVAVDDPTYTDIYPTGVGIPANDDYSAPSFIFKLQYDETTDSTTLTLVYAAYLNLTKYAPIAPSAAIGRYESGEIQRIYFSDFYNKVKTLNVSDPQVMAMNPVLTGLSPSVNFDIPIMTNIITGSLNVGTYELCYRLKQTLGAITNYSTLSNMVHLASPDISDFAAYEGSVPGSNSNKGIRFKISNIDNAYDTIEYIVTFRDSKTDVAKVYSLNEVSIPSSGVVSVDVTTLSTADEILLTDFLTIQSAFTHAKTVDTKDNRLFWGNVKSKKASLPNWDARAFRAIGNSNPTWNDIHLINAGVPTGAITLAAAQALPKTDDCINEYYDNTGAFGANACYFKPGTAILGGAGANISYEFGTYSTQLNDLSHSSVGDDSANIYQDAIFRGVPGYTDTLNLLTPALTNDSQNQKYIQDALNCLKSPYRSSLLDGFQHEEIYRFGFEAYDLEGVPFFTEWIADIKMPSYGDPNPNPDRHASGAGISDFRLSYDNNGNGIWGQTLYIKFSVDVTALADVISGYRIVRMERNSNANKTILGCGILTSSYVDNTTDNTNAYLPANFYGIAEVFLPNPARNVPFHPYPNQEECEQLYCDGTAAGISTDWQKIKTFDCFEFNLNGGASFATGDKLFIRSRVRGKNYRRAGSGDNQGYIKALFAASGNNINDWLANDFITGVSGGPLYPSYISPGLGVATGGPRYQTGYDSNEQPYYLHMYMDNSVFGTFAATTSGASYNKTLSDAQFVFGNDSVTVAGTGLTFNNWGRSYRAPGGVTDPGAAYNTYKTCYGVRTIACGLTGGNEYDDSNAPFSCVRTSNDKLLALYYKPNTNQYGGNTYSARAGNEYIVCGSYIPVRRNSLVLTNNLSLEIDVLGGDVRMNYWDIQKAQKSTEGPPYYYYSQTAGPSVSNHPGSLTGVAPDLTSAVYNISVSYFFPCTSQHNIEMRYGDHVNTQLLTNTYAVEDENFYPTYHSNESNIVKFTSQPLDFVETDKWINRVFYSEIKYNNETKDSWQVYKTNNFYDVEGNYGSINALVAFRENLYYIQERGFGILYVNPMTAVTSDNNIPVVLGLGATIQRHNYIKLDVGTMHQWSVFRSPDNISFIDSRHKTQYLFNGQSLEPVSDLKGQRNFFIKRFHPSLILRDNPIIGKGVHTTYDYYHKEFLTTFNNDNLEPTAVDSEKYTLVYSEPINAYSSLYTCTPRIHFNNNRYILSFDNTDSFYVHNVGYYGTFYNTETPSSIKVLVNDHPLYTKVFDNLIIGTESVDDQVEWIEEVITPDSNNQTYSDNINKPDDTFNAIRCYTETYNSDWTTLTLNTNIKKKEQSWFTPIPRNKVDYDVLVPGTSTIFDPTVLTKVDFGERMRDKYVVIDLRYDNTNNYRFIVHNLKTLYRVSPR